MTNDTRLIWATNQAVSSLLRPVRKQANNAGRVKNKNPVPLKEIENAAGNLASRKISPLRGHGSLKVVRDSEVVHPAF